MNMNDLQGEQLKKFQQQRDTLLDFIRSEVHPVLQQVESSLGRKEGYSLPEKQLAETSFTLALVGAFQSGKSTFFNYLCDGRELSPIGPGGGGIRTSGCRVAAHPLQEGEEEYALVTWRSAKDLLNSFGDVLDAEYPDININQLNLDDPACRKDLEKKAWELLNEPDVKDDDRELLYFAMLVSHFYPEYAGRCKKGEERCTPEEAAELSSYPQNWENLWLTTKQADGNLSAFTAKQVAFAFCGGVDLYLDSANLKALGCSIVDCPGLFASTWDTQIATECIAEANAILYMFRGDKAMTQQDLEALRNCVKLGGNAKIIFGANLHTDRNNWKRIINDSISPQLTKEGFPNTVVHEFHSAMALRSRELFLLTEFGALPEISRRAIELDMTLSKRPQPYDDKAIVKFITKRLKKFLERLRDDDEDVEDEELEPVFLENESGAPAFLRAANNMVIARRGRSILAENGIRRVHYALDQADNEIERQLELLAGDIEAARADLDEQQRAIDKFEEKRKRACQALADRIDVANRAIERHYKQVMEKTLLMSDAGILSLIEKRLVPWYDVILEKINSQKKAERIRDFKKEIQKEINTVSKKVFVNLRDSFSGLEEVGSMRRTYEDLRAELMEEVTKLKHIPSMDNIIPSFPKNFSENVSSMVINVAVDELLSKDMTWYEWIFSIFTAGGIAVFKNDKDRAMAVFNEIYPKLKGSLWSSLKDSLNAEARQDAPAGPLHAIQELQEEFSKAFEEPKRDFEKNRESLEQVLADALENGKTILEELHPLKEQVTHLLTECDELETSINEDFPAHQ